MLILLIGVVCAFAAFRSTRAPGLSGRLAFLCGTAVTALVLVQVAAADESIRQYRIALLGMRYALADPGAGLLGDTIQVGSDYDAADLYVDVPGRQDVARLWAEGDSQSTVVLVSQAEDAQAVVAVQGGEGMRIVGARALGQGDTVVLSRPTLARLSVVRGPGALPWREEHALHDGRGKRAVLPPARMSWRDRLVDRRPGPFQRTYPLADVLEQIDPGADRGELSSFFFYDEGRLSFVDLDSEVSVGSASAPAAVDTAWFTGGGERRMMVAGLAFRDHRDTELTGAERYGLRPLRSGQVRVEGPWLDFYLASPEIRSFGKANLGQLSLDARTRRSPCAGREGAFRVHVSPVRQTYARRAITFSAPPRLFESASQAVLSLPCTFAPGPLRVLSPSGTLRVETGAPFSLGDGRREVLLRVDAKRLALAGRLLAVGFLLLPSLLLLWLPVPSVVRGLAIVALGLAAVRLLLGLSTGVEYPYLQEANQTGLWMLPVLPWAVLAAGSRAHLRRPVDPWLHAAYAALMMAAAFVIFVDSVGKAVVLGAIPPLVWLAVHANILREEWRRRTSAGGWTSRVERALRDTWTRVRTVGRWLARVLPERLRTLPARYPGLAFGGGLLLLRLALAATGNNEALRVGSTRVGLSVVYTPLSLLLLVEVLRRQEALLREGGDRPRSPVLAVLDVWAYLVLAFVGVAFMVSDLGLALTTLPGALVFLLLAADRWSAGAPDPRRFTAVAGVSAALALPLVLFALVQLQPQIPLETGDASQPHFRMQQWKTSQLRVLEFGDPGALQTIGQRRSEALGAMSETMRAYTRGPWQGAGYFASEVSPELRATAAQEHVVSALLVGQWGWFGAMGLVLMLCALLAPVAPWWRSASPPPTRPWRSAGALAALLLGVLLVLSYLLPLSGSWRPLTLLLVVVCPVVLALAWAHRATAEGSSGVQPYARTEAAAALFLITLAMAGLYMVLANYGMALFTGKNVYVLGLDSIGDVLESLALFTGAALWLPREDPPTPSAAR
jgi:hypothetical protein